MPPVGERATIKAALPGTKGQIVKKTGLSMATSIKWVDRLHKDGEIHIARWKAHPRAGPAMPVYVAGPGVDAVCDLVHLTKQQIRERFEKKAEADGRMDKRRAMWRNRYWKLKAAKSKQNWASALGLGAQ